MIDIWKIGVEIAVAGNAEQALVAIGKKLFGLGKSAEAVTGKLGQLAKIAAFGGMAVGAGAGILMMFKPMIEHGEKLIDQQARFKAALKDSGMTAIEMSAEVARATKRAIEVSQTVPGTSVTENLKGIRELRMAFGNEEDAEKYLETLEKARMVIFSLTGKDAGEQVFSMAKAMEMKGVTMDPAHFVSAINDMVKAAVASGGRVLGTDFQSTIMYLRQSRIGLSDDFLFKYMPTLMQEMKTGAGGSGGGARGPGNALMTAYNAIIGGHMTKAAAAEFVRLGLASPKDLTKHGGLVPGSVKGSKEYTENPYQWVQDFLMPALKKAGIDITNKAAVQNEISKLLSARTGADMIATMATQQVRFEKDKSLIQQAGGLDSLDQLMKESPAAKMKAFTEAWDNLLTALGAPIVDQAYGMLGRITKVLNDLGVWAFQHPTLTKVIEDLVIGLGGLSIALGAFAIGTAAASALGILTSPAVGLMALAVGITALGAALPSIPQWLIKMAAGAAAGAAGGLMLGGPAGAGMGAIGGAMGGLLYYEMFDANKRPLDSLMEQYQKGQTGEGLLGVPTLMPGVPPPPAAAPALPSPNPAAPVPPPGSQQHSEDTRGSASNPVHVVVQNGRDLANGAAKYIGDQANRPSTGPTGPNVRVSPLMPGFDMFAYPG